MSQNMPVVIPNSVKERMLTFLHTYMHAEKHKMMENSLLHMEKCVSLMK